MNRVRILAWLLIVLVAVAGGWWGRREILANRPVQLRSFRVHDGGPGYRITPDKLPYSATCSLANGDCVLFTFPSGKTLALWAEPWYGTAEAKSGLWCTIGEQPFAEPKLLEKRLPDGSTTHPGLDSYIHDSGDRINFGKARTHDLRIDDFLVSYTMDLNSEPRLRVDIFIR